MKFISWFLVAALFCVGIVILLARNSGLITDTAASITFATLILASIGVGVWVRAGRRRRASR